MQDPGEGAFRAKPGFGSLQFGRFGPTRDENVLEWRCVSEVHAASETICVLPAKPVVVSSCAQVNGSMGSSMGPSTGLGRGRRKGIASWDPSGSVLLAADPGMDGGERVHLVFSFPHHAVARFRHLVPRPGEVK